MKSSKSPNVNPSSDIFNKLRNMILPEYKNAYEMELTYWKNIEDKAQSTVSISGIFIAAAFAFVNVSELELDIIGQILAAISLTSFSLSIYFSILAMFVRPLTVLSFGETEKKLLSQIKNDSLDEFKELDIFSMLADTQIEQWSRAIKSVRSNVVIKSQRLKYSQLLLVVAIFSVALLTLSIILNI
jgi:hypothetical protein